MGVRPEFGSPAMGISADSAGNLYFATGNGSYDGTASGDYGDSVSS